MWTIDFVVLCWSTQLVCESFPLSFRPPHCDCLNHNSIGHLMQMVSEPTNPLSGWRTSAPSHTGDGAGAVRCPDGRQCATSYNMHPSVRVHTEIQSHPTKLLSSRFPALLPMILGPHFVVTLASPPSVVSCPAQVCTVGLVDNLLLTLLSDAFQSHDNLQKTNTCKAISFLTCLFKISLHSQHLPSILMVWIQYFYIGPNTLLFLMLTLSTS